MKHRLCSLLLLLSLLLTACQTKTQSPADDSFALYFPRTQVSMTDGSMTKMTVELSEEDRNIKQLMEVYMAAIAPKGAYHAIEGWMLDNAYLEGTTAVINFSGPEMSSLQANVAAACLLQTLMQLPNIDAVRLGVPGISQPISLTYQELLLSDTGMLPQKESIVYYVPDEHGRFLSRQRHTVEAMELQEKPGYVLQLLLKHISEETRLLGIVIENGICTVNLSSEFVSNMPKSFQAERLSVYSIVNSLTEMAEITAVDFWIEGAPLQELSFMELPAGLQRKESLIAPLDTNVEHATLYVSCDAERLVALPCGFQNPEGKDIKELTLQELIGFESADGAFGCIPEGTRMLSLRMEGNACIIDLTGEFLSGCKNSQQELLAVKSIVATMCAFENVSSVEILVEGLEPTYQVNWLKNVRQTELSWFAEG